MISNKSLNRQIAEQEGWSALECVLPYGELWCGIHPQDFAVWKANQRNGDFGPAVGSHTAPDYCNEFGELIECCMKRGLTWELSWAPLRRNKTGGHFAQVNDFRKWVKGFHMLGNAFAECYLRAATNTEPEE